MAFNINSNPYLGAPSYGSPYQYGGGVASPFPTFQSGPLQIQQMLAGLLQAISALSSQWGGLAGGAGNTGLAGSAGNVGLAGNVGSAGSGGAYGGGGTGGASGAYGGGGGAGVAYQAPAPVQAAVAVQVQAPPAPKGGGAGAYG